MSSSVSNDDTYADGSPKHLDPTPDAVDVATDSPPFWERLRSWYLHAVTFGAWRRLGNYALDLAGDLVEEKERADRLEYRLDGLMRILGVETGLTIPAEIDAPRLTTFGAGLEIEEEARLMREGLEAEKAGAAMDVVLGAGAALERLGVVTEKRLPPTTLCEYCRGVGTYQCPIDGSRDPKTKAWQFETKKCPHCE